MNPARRSYSQIDPRDLFEPRITLITRVKPTDLTQPGGFSPSVLSVKSVVLCVLFLFGLMAGAAAAEPEMRLSPKKVRDEVHSVVEAQLAALRREDFAAAYALASARIKARFEERFFAAMLRRSYAPLLRSTEAEFGVVRDKDGRLAQVTVTVRDQLKRSTIYRYWLVWETDGWRINGVTLEQKPPRGDI
jgi:hypothetical protein